MIARNRPVELTLSLPRRAELDAALAALQSKSGEQDALLKKIADAMEASKKNVGKVEMDPALTEETKKLLG